MKDVFGKGNKSACGGVLQDHNVSFICGFGANLGGCLVLIAELKAMMVGLKLAWSRRFQKICVNFDSPLEVELLSEECYMLHPCYNIIREIHLVHKNEREITWNHIYREANKLHMVWLSMLWKMASLVFLNFLLFQFYI